MKEFYSNCLFEAIKAKIKEWKNIKIFFIPTRFNDESLFHFMWLNTSSNELYDFKADKPITMIFKSLLFRGLVRKIDFKNYYSHYMNAKVTKFLKDKYRKEELRFERKYGYVSQNTSLEFYNYWHEKWHYLSDSEYPTLEDNFGDLIQVLIENNGSLQLGLMQLTEDGIQNSSNLKIKCWRYFNAPVNTDDYFFSVF